MTVLLQLSQFSLERGEHFILPPFDWQVQTGEHWCILGPNGCGKTSLLSSITGYAPPTAGTLDLFGYRYGASAWQEVRQAVGVVSTGLLPYIDDQERAEDLVVSGKQGWLTNWGAVPDKDRKRALRLLKSLHCSHISGCQWATLSQGERQRVLIARALMARIRILFLDEPCSGLDPLARHQFLESLEELAHKDKPAQIMVTHHVEEIIPSCTHVLLLGHEGLVAQGPKKMVLNSKHLSSAFGHALKLYTQRGRYRLSFED